MEPNRDMLVDIFKMVKENNQMLHAMRRRAFVGGFLKVIILTTLIVTPIWFYMTYLDSTVQDILQTVQKMQDAGSSAQQQLNGIQSIWDNLQGKFPSFMSGSSTGQ
jgi:hypothetical protein